MPVGRLNMIDLEKMKKFISLTNGNAEIGIRIYKDKVDSCGCPSENGEEVYRFIYSIREHNKGDISTGSIDIDVKEGDYSIVLKQIFGKILEYMEKI